MAWFSAGPQTNPSDQSVLADTGAVVTGNNTACYVILTSNATASAILESRNTSNTTTLVSQFIRVLPNATASVAMGNIVLAPNERLRVIQSGALAGVVHASITY